MVSRATTRNAIVCILLMHRPDERCAAFVTGPPRANRPRSSKRTAPYDKGGRTRPPPLRSVNDSHDGDVMAVRTVVRSALSNIRDVMDPDFFPSSSGESSILKQFHTKCVTSVKGAPSSVPGAGMGLFALKNIKAGTVISLYPVHCLGVEFEEDEGGPAPPSDFYFGMDESDDDYFHRAYDDDVSDAVTSNYRHYIPGSRPLLSWDIQKTAGAVLFADVNPDRPNNERSVWLSHLINDGAVVNANNEEAVLSYYRASRKAKNCVNVPFGPSPFLATVTTRKVKKGEELFTSYGCSFWLDAVVAAAAAEGNAEDSTDITEAIQAEVKEVARDLFTSMQSVGGTYATQNNAFQLSFQNIDSGN